MNDAGRLLADGLHDARMSVSEGVHPQPGYEVEIFFAFEVVEENTFAALEADGIAVVGGKKKTLFKVGDVIEAGHGLIVERTSVDTAGHGTPRRTAANRGAIAAKLKTSVIHPKWHPKKKKLPSIIHSLHPKSSL